MDRYDPVRSYKGIDEKAVWQDSCWFVSDGMGQALRDNADEVLNFDGVPKDGLVSLEVLQYKGML